MATYIVKCDSCSDTFEKPYQELLGVISVCQMCMTDVCETCKEQHDKECPEPKGDK